MNVVQKRLLLVFSIICFTLAASAQSMYWPDGKEYFRKVESDIYEYVPNGVITYKIGNGKSQMLWSNGEIYEADPIGHYEKTGKRIKFYKNDEWVGYYSFDNKYFVMVSYGGEKEAIYARFNDGKLFADSGQLLYSVDKGISLEVLGIMLFVH